MLLEFFSDEYLSICENEIYFTIEYAKRIKNYFARIVK